MLRQIDTLDLHTLSEDQKDTLLSELWQIYEKHVIEAKIKRRKYLVAKSEDENYLNEKRKKSAEAYRKKYAEDEEFRESQKAKNRANRLRRQAKI